MADSSRRNEVVYSAIYDGNNIEFSTFHAYGMGEERVRVIVQESDPRGVLPMHRVSLKAQYERIASRDKLRLLEIPKDEIAAMAIERGANVVARYATKPIGRLTWLGNTYILFHVPEELIEQRRGVKELVTFNLSRDS